MASRPLNSHVYEKTFQQGLKAPDIPVYDAQHYSQCGEDIVVAALIEAYCLLNGKSPSFFKYCEIGANHPIATSATFLLNQKLGMTGVLIEANPALIPALESTRSQDVIVHAAVTDSGAETVALTLAEHSELSSLHTAFVDDWKGSRNIGQVTVPAVSLQRLFEEHFDGAAPFFLSVDIEGMDLQIIKTNNFERYRPVFILCEPSDHFIENNSLQMIKFLQDQNYTLLARTDVNLLFCDKFAFAL